MIQQSTSAVPPPDFSLKSPRQPMLWVAAAYGCGILLGVHAWRPALWWVVAVVWLSFSAACLVRRRSGFSWMLAVGIFVVSGAFHVQTRSAFRLLDTSVVNFADRQPVELTAHVIKDGRLTSIGSGEVRQTVDVEAEEIRTKDGVPLPVHSKIRLGIYVSSGDHESNEDAREGARTSASMRVFGYGERIRCIARLRRSRNFRNPGAFDYEGYLAERGIAALGSAKFEDVTLLPGFAGNWLEAMQGRTHRSVIEKVHRLWKASDAALIDAMIIGEDAFIDRDTRTDFQRSGTYHVLVVSGMNVSILAFVVFWTLRRLRIGEIPSTLLTIALCVAYAFVTEVGAPVWRATVMCAVYLLTRLLYRERAMLNAVGSAAFAVLIYDPRQIFTASFQMTFLCVLIVAAVGVPILQRTSQLYKQALRNWDSNDYAAYLPPRVAQFRLDLHLVAVRLALFVGEKWSTRLVRSAVYGLFAAAELVFISAVMQMGLALPMAYYFHRATTLGVPANLMVVPLTQLMMPAALTALMLGYIGSWIAKLPVLVTTLALHGISGTVHQLGHLQLADLRVAIPSATTLMLSAVALIFAMWAGRRHYAIASMGLGGLLATSLVLALIAPSPQIRPGVLEVTSIDVGEGDSTLLVTPEGKTLLIDAGGPLGPGASQFDFGEDVVSPYLWSRGIARLDAVAISHAHSDHAGGIAAVLKNFRPNELWLGLEPRSPILSNVLATAEILKIPVVRRWEGDQFDFGGARFEVLHPPRDTPIGDKPLNNDSMVVRASFVDTSVLLEGDAETRVERYITSTHHPSATLLKVGHHGSANATTSEFISSVKPRFAIISVGSGNSFGLPRLKTLAKLAESGTQVYRTDLDGNVSFYLDGRSVTASVAALR